MMQDQIVDFHEPVTLLGGGAADRDQLRLVLQRASKLVAADGGANMAVAEGFSPDLVIGDFDSITDEVRARIPAGRQMIVPEQATTDFEKCLTRIAAPLILALGFMGPRMDHAMAVWNALVRHPGRRCILIGAEDLVFAAPERMVLDLAPGTRLSLFPMARLTGVSAGLKWPLQGLQFAPDGMIATSNEALGAVDLRFSGPGMIAIVPVACLDQVIQAFDGIAPR